MYRVVVMGVAGSGKSTIASAIASRLGLRYVDADDLHPPANVMKMAKGSALTDRDRWPWLVEVRRTLREADGDGVVVACSALARRYRDLLRGADGTLFVFLDVDEVTAVARTTGRSGHYMGAGMVGGQFEALERPDELEADVHTIDGNAATDLVVADAVGWITR